MTCHQFLLFLIPFSGLITTIASQKDKLNGKLGVINIHIRQNNYLCSDLSCKSTQPPKSTTVGPQPNECKDTKVEYDSAAMDKSKVSVITEIVKKIYRENPKSVKDTQLLSVKDEIVRKFNEHHSWSVIPMYPEFQAYPVAYDEYVKLKIGCHYVMLITALKKC